MNYLLIDLFITPIYFLNEIYYWIIYKINNKFNYFFIHPQDTKKSYILPVFSASICTN